MISELHEPSTGDLVHTGYKQTEIGLVPSDWVVGPLGEHVTITSGVSPSLIALGSGNLPYFKVEQLGNSGKYLTRQSTPYHFDSGPTVPPKSVVFAKRGAAIALNKVRIMNDASFMDTNLMALSPTNKLDYEYLYYALGHVGLWRFADTTSVPQINNKHIKPLPFAFPSLNEQRAIAIALSDVDALIAGLEQLIAKKRDIKQAAMQQLLTGQTRLPGFSEQWKPRRLGHLGAFLKGSGVKRDQALSGELPCIRYGEIYTVHSDVVRSFHSRISPQVAATATRIQRGDLLFAGSGETKAEIGKCVAIASSVEAYAGGDVVILRLRAGDPSFFGYFLNTPAIARQKANLGQGDAVVHISASALSGIEVQVPTVEEQIAIATVLADMDADLSVLESRLAKTRAIKHGMMQELLIGKTRLVDLAEQTPVQKTEPVEKRKANVHFMRSVLAAEIVDQLHQEPTFGHVKFEKMMFLAEHLCQVDTGSHYARKAAGPLDRHALHSIDSQLRKQAWFDVRKENGRYRYVPLEKRGGHQPYFNRYFATIRTQLSEILDTFRSWETERCEIVATLYAAWNDLLKEKGSVSDDMIVHEVLNNWHESKQRIPEERWLKALGWMREKGYVPGPVAESIAR